ncbi:hypothetical protein CYMTET_37872 [Cymbomonas tetramitiformis]|uniref:Uncharacterized protein n=1 Tax=Cymbomonas tetramitiformis TaxID=36881 RepID=A0AAE0CD27_9CHLO|nr:hypothetical protein CYMTET_37872 [Cymbomonas tetramitiformis]
MAAFGQAGHSLVGGTAQELDGFVDTLREVPAPLRELRGTVAQAIDQVEQQLAEAEPVRIKQKMLRELTVNPKLVHLRLHHTGTQSSLARVRTVKKEEAEVSPSHAGVVEKHLNNMGKMQLGGRGHIREAREDCIHVLHNSAALELEEMQQRVQELELRDHSRSRGSSSPEVGQANAGPVSQTQQRREVLLQQLHRPQASVDGHAPLGPIHIPTSHPEQPRYSPRPTAPTRTLEPPAARSTHHEDQPQNPHLPHHPEEPPSHSQRTNDLPRHPQYYKSPPHNPHHPHHPEEPPPRLKTTADPPQHLHTRPPFRGSQFSDAPLHQPEAREDLPYHSQFRSRVAQSASHGMWHRDEDLTRAGPSQTSEWYSHSQELAGHLKQLEESVRELRWQQHESPHRQQDTLQRLEDVEARVDWAEALAPSVARLAEEADLRQQETHIMARSLQRLEQLARQSHLPPAPPPPRYADDGPAGPHQASWTQQLSPRLATAQPSPLSAEYVSHPSQLLGQMAYEVPQSYAQTAQRVVQPPAQPGPAMARPEGEHEVPCLSHQLSTQRGYQQSAAGAQQRQQQGPQLQHHHHQQHHQQPQQEPPQQRQQQLQQQAQGEPRLQPPLQHAAALSQGAESSWATKSTVTAPELPAQQIPGEPPVKDAEPAGAVPAVRAGQVDVELIGASFVGTHAAGGGEGSYAPGIDKHTHLPAERQQCTQAPGGNEYILSRLEAVEEQVVGLVRERDGLLSQLEAQNRLLDQVQQRSTKHIHQRASLIKRHHEMACRAHAHRGLLRAWRQWQRWHRGRRAASAGLASAMWRQKGLALQLWRAGAHACRSRRRLVDRAATWRATTGSWRLLGRCCRAWRHAVGTALHQIRSVADAQQRAAHKEQMRLLQEKLQEVEEKEKMASVQEANVDLAVDEVLGRREAMVRRREQDCAEKLAQTEAEAAGRRARLEGELVAERLKLKDMQATFMRHVDEVVAEKTAQRLAVVKEKEQLATAYLKQAQAHEQVGPSALGLHSLPTLVTLCETIWSPAKLPTRKARSETGWGLHQAMAETVAEAVAKSLRGGEAVVAAREHEVEQRERAVKAEIDKAKAELVAAQEQTAAAAAARATLAAEEQGLQWRRSQVERSAADNCLQRQQTEMKEAQAIERQEEAQRLSERSRQDLLAAEARLKEKEAAVQVKIKEQEEAAAARANSEAAAREEAQRGLAEREARVRSTEEEAQAEAARLQADHKEEEEKQTKMWQQVMELHEGVRTHAAYLREWQGQVAARETAAAAAVRNAEERARLDSLASQLAANEAALADIDRKEAEHARTSQAEQAEQERMDMLEQVRAWMKRTAREQARLRSQEHAVAGELKRKEQRILQKAKEAKEMEDKAQALEAQCEDTLASSRATMLELRTLKDKLLEERGVREVHTCQLAGREAHLRHWESTAREKMSEVAKAAGEIRMKGKILDEFKEQLTRERQLLAVEKEHAIGTQNAALHTSHVAPPPATNANAPPLAMHQSAPSLATNSDALHPAVVAAPWPGGVHGSSHAQEMFAVTSSTSTHAPPSAPVLTISLSTDPLIQASFKSAPEVNKDPGVNSVPSASSANTASDPGPPTVPRSVPIVVPGSSHAPSATSVPNGHSTPQETAQVECVNPDLWNQCAPIILP